ncbi:MAG: cysteine--tRNA ligase [Oscillospiraceae bacterium]|jgi:cysteinyl-tRNA synthetase|nr:cysteine--tRNA ligase [Oscillospiraceae bacterium]
MRIYNTLTRRKEEFVPLTPNEARIYGCGPTVYNLIHIGNALPLCVFDTLRRYLEWRGWNVRFVQNFTDVDDKIIRRANEEGVTSAEIAEKYIAEYWTDAKGLNVKPATVHPKATETMDEIIAMVSALEEKGYAYEADGDVYFSPKAFPEYGKLSHQPLEDLEAGARIMVGEVKRDPMDFALWKAAKPGEPSWDSPWGKGRPGWHIECSAMAKKHLGDTIDIHGGGADLIFPHHENEIAQSECCNGVPFAHYWMHNGFINVDHVKMSKSLGNFFTVRDVAEAYGYEPIRFLLISSHYRSPFNYSVEAITQAKSALQRLYTCRENLEFAIQRAPSGDITPQQQAILGERKEEFIAGMEDDLNTAAALGAVFDLVSCINIKFLGESASKEALEAALGLFNELTDVLGLLYNKPAADEEDFSALLAERAEARKAKNWARADAIRDELKAKGYRIEDTPQGAKVVKL